MPDSGDKGGGNGTREWRVEGWLDLVLTVAIALAAVGTAWAGFQSAKWSGVQANSYAKAGALRAESTRASTRAGQQLTIDVVSFTEWASALDREARLDPAKTPDSGYRPDPKELSGLLFQRFRPEFQRAALAWVATKPLKNPNAPATPFAMPSYRLAAQADADRLLDEAEELSATARTANQRSDNYVLTAVLFALVLFFASVTQKARGRSAKILFVLTVTALIFALILLAFFPVEV